LAGKIKKNLEKNLEKGQPGWAGISPLISDNRRKCGAKTPLSWNIHPGHPSRECGFSLIIDRNKE
jgi:hypothetical protein